MFQNILLDTLKFPIFGFLQHVFPNSNDVGGIPKIYEKRPEVHVIFEYRIEGNQMEDRSSNKMWLVRHLEVTRQIMLEDLKVAKVTI